MAAYLGHTTPKLLLLISSVSPINILVFKVSNSLLETHVLLILMIWARK
jgi:hypothetical protein